MVWSQRYGISEGIKLGLNFPASSGASLHPTWFNGALVWRPVPADLHVSRFGDSWSTLRRWTGWRGERGSGNLGDHKMWQDVCDRVLTGYATLSGMVWPAKSQSWTSNTCVSRTLALSSKTMQLYTLWTPYDTFPVQCFFFARRAATLVELALRFLSTAPQLSFVSWRRS